MNTKTLLIFFVLNFGALAIGSLFIGNGVTSNWYVSLEKAPWTPPGPVFGIAWTVIMICFSLFMTYLWEETKNKKELLILFGIQWILNICWNLVFFRFHEKLLALLLITSLTVIVFYFLWSTRNLLQSKSLLVLPYFLWLLIATSLNGYIYFYN